MLSKFQIKMVQNFLLVVLNLWAAVFCCWQNGFCLIFLFLFLTPPQIGINHQRPLPAKIHTFDLSLVSSPILHIFLPLWVDKDQILLHQVLDLLLFFTVLYYPSISYHMWVYSLPFVYDSSIPFPVSVSFWAAFLAPLLLPPMCHKSP